MNKISKTIVLVLSIALIGWFGTASLSQAGAEHNTSGYAWSENIGWISFNSISDGSTVNYGVNVDTDNGKFSGYAWSENIGWISFNESDTGAPPLDDPCSDTSCIAKATPPSQLGTSNVNVSGWARALAYGEGWDGWLRFDHGQSNEVYVDASGDFHGWVWGDDVLGWTSFNSSDSGAGGSAYKVATSFVFTEELTVSLSASPNPVDYNTASTLTWSSTNAASCTASGDWSDSKSISGSQSTGNLTSVQTYTLTCTGPGGSASDSVTVDVNPGDLPPIVTDPLVSTHDPLTYCSTARHNFSWIYSDANGDNQSRFDFQVDDNSDFSSREVDRTYTGLSNPSPTTNNQTVIVVTSPGSDQLGYNTVYYWRVQVWDEHGSASGWIEGDSFTTALHRYPTIDFDWAPLYPSEGETVLFADQSTVYGGAAKSIWSWIFEDGDPLTSSEQNPTIQFTSEGDKQVALEVIDSDGFMCPGSKILGIESALPFWKEILPWW